MNHSPALPVRIVHPIPERCPKQRPKPVPDPSSFLVGQMVVLIRIRQDRKGRSFFFQRFDANFDSGNTRVNPGLEDHPNCPLTCDNSGLSFVAQQVQPTLTVINKCLVHHPRWGHVLPSSTDNEAPGRGLPETLSLAHGETG